MKIIMLTGKSSSGKTTTLNMVYDHINPKTEDIIFPKSKLGGDNRDFKSVIKYNGKTIAFYTMGDYSGCVLEAFEKYKQYDFLICACNDRFKRPFSQIKKYQHKIIEKTFSKKKECYNDSNTKDRDSILNEIK